MNQQQIVEQIHKEIDESEEKAYATLDEILEGINISDIDENAEVFSSLESLGVSSHQSTMVQEAKDKIRSQFQERHTITAQKSFIERMGSKTTGYKVISYKDLHAIMKKYNLYMAAGLKFKGDMPVKSALDLKEYNQKHSTRLAKFFMPSFMQSEGCLFVIATFDQFAKPSRNESTTIVGRELVYRPQVNLELKRPKLPEFKDPIVVSLLGQENGMPQFHIVTKWGPEAEIPEIKV